MSRLRGANMSKYCVVGWLNSYNQILTLKCHANLCLNFTESQSFTVRLLWRSCNCYYFSLSVFQNICINCLSTIVLLFAVMFCEKMTMK